MRKLPPVLLTALAVGCSSPGPGTSQPQPEPPDDIPIDGCEVADGTSSPLRLLTRTEYNNTVRDLLSDATQPAGGFPAENQVLGFDNNATAHIASQAHVDRYQLAAVEVAARAVDEAWGQLVPCDPAVAGNSACGRQFIEGFGRRAFRRALTEAEFGTFEGLFDVVMADSGFEVAVESTLQAMLQAPQFLYRAEYDGTFDPETGRVALSSTAMATRLAYTLWGSTPDEALLAKAEQDGLRTAEQIEAEARRMLADPRVAGGIENFYEQVLNSRSFDSMSRDTSFYPTWDPSLALDLKRSLHAFMHEILVERNDGFDALFDSTDVYVNERLSSLLGLPPPEGDFSPVSASPDQRSGLLTQPGLMALLGKPDQSDPIARGVFVVERIMCRAVLPPPPNAAITPPDPDPNATTRERFAQHVEEPGCFGCHQSIDPIGFSFEHYDALGGWRAEENGVPIDASGAIPEARDPEIIGPVSNAVELAQRLRFSSEVPECMAKEWFRFALGRVEGSQDVCEIRKLAETFTETGDFKELIVELTTMPSFRTRAPTDEESSQ